MKKLTLVSLMCRRKVITQFCILPTNKNGKPLLTQTIIDDLFENAWGFIPTRGETISFL